MHRHIARAQLEISTSETLTLTLMSHAGCLEVIEMCLLPVACVITIHHHTTSARCALPEMRQDGCLITKLLHPSPQTLFVMLFKHLVTCHLALRLHVHHVLQGSLA